MCQNIPKKEESRGNNVATTLPQAFNGLLAHDDSRCQPIPPHALPALPKNKSVFVTSKAKEKTPAYGCLATMKTATQATDSAIPMTSKALLQFDLP